MLPSVSLSLLKSSCLSLSTIGIKVVCCHVQLLGVFDEHLILESRTGKCLWPVRQCCFCISIPASLFSHSWEEVGVQIILSKQLLSKGDLLDSCLPLLCCWRWNPKALHMLGKHPPMSSIPASPKGLLPQLHLPPHPPLPVLGFQVLS